MSDVKNSLSSIVDNLIKLQRNNTEILTKLSAVVNSDADVVTLTLEDIANDNIKTVTIPSFGALKKDIERLDENITQISALNNKDASVQLPDGTFRTIVKSTLKKSADDIVKVQTPTGFKSKSNWFFESFLNPLLYVGLNFPTQLDPDTTKVKMQKFILNLDTEAKLNIFNLQIKNNPDLSYADFLDLINTNGILYTIDDDVLDLPPVEPRFYGNFSVLRVFESTENIVVDGVDTTKKTQKFQLDKITYNDKNSSTLETQQLKVGDSLLVNKNDKSTRYKVTGIDFETFTISVILAEGYDSVNIGADNLSFYPVEAISPEIRVGIGFNEYLSVFLKPINPDSNRPADNYSPGISFYSNELTIKDTDSVVKTLDTYYQEKVVDFGAVLFSMTQENIPPVSKAIVPNVPQAVVNDFKVVQINKHATDGQSNEDIKSLNKEKLSLKSELGDLDKAISTKRQQISTKNYKSDIERDSDNNQLQTLIEKRAATESLYNSVVSDILTKAEDKTTSTANAKYRVRGFWPLPENRIATDGSEQSVIQFKIQYRYLTKGGAANNLQEFDFSDADGNTQKGVYSNWVSMKSPLRERYFDADTGRYYWKEQDTENGEQVNINQLDIPIRPNETVEIKIKSLSEAGYPANPIESEFCNIISIEFPDDLGISKDILSIIDETNNEKVKVRLNEDLTERGVYTHINDQFVQNSITWKHQSANIASGFLSEERNVISLLDYLKSLEDKISSLEAQINKTVGILLIKVEDESGNQKIVQNNTTVPIFAGNYKDEVSSLDEPKGTIITKNYFIRIENDAATPIQLSAALKSNVSSLAFDNDGSKFEQASTQYSTLPSLGLSNPANEDITNPNHTAYNLPYQSAQVKGQFIYSRGSDITTTKDLFEAPNTILGNMHRFENNISTTTINNYKVNSNFFIWDGVQTTSGVVNGHEASTVTFDPNQVYVHCQHPDLFNTNTIVNDEWIDKNTSISRASNLNVFANPTDFYKQTAFGQGSIGAITDTTNKISFQENDKYLLGERSCGCYLYLSPLGYENIRVEGNDKISKKELSLGSSNAIVLQVVYQYRMTDYFGAGKLGIGKISGKDGITQLEYRKILGLDLYYDESKFSFDIEITSRYKSNSISASDVPSSTFQNTINQTTNNVNQITPNI
tara:strand:+ start:655 stop:4110 length:3456 start_codon:yes stop_codon:yes gene_type:complete